MNVISFLTKLIEKQDLTITESKMLMEEILMNRLTSSQIGAFLTALRIKGEVFGEILGFITVMRQNMIRVRTDGIVIDTCGTGGDGSGTFNISTVTAFVVVGAGVKVAKHGNKSASGFCGSADVLETLGVNINLLPQQAEDLLKKTRFTFLFAPLYHPSMKYVALVRKELKIRTVFNFLGPFVNPTGVRRQLIGVPNKELAQKLAQVAKKLEYEHLMIVASDDGLDEVSISAPTHIFEIQGEKVTQRIISPEDFGINKAKRKDLRGGNAQSNANIIRQILGGEIGPKRDVVLLNSAAALYVSGKVKNLMEGLELAKESIDKGRAKNVLEKTIKYSQNL